MSDVNIRTSLEGASQVEQGLRRLANSVTGLGTSTGKLGKDASAVSSLLSNAIGGLKSELGAITPAPIQGVVTALSGIAGPAGIALAAVTALAGSTIGLTIALGNNVEQLQNMASRMGLTVEQVQKLQFVAKQSGIDVGALTNSIFILNQRMVEAVSGNERLAKAFELMGISLRDKTTGELRNAYDVLLDLDDRLSDLKGPEKAKVAMAIMGRGAREALIVMNGSLRETTVLAETSGNVMSEKLLKAGIAADAAADKMSAAWGGVKNAMMEKFIPGIEAGTRYLESFAGWLTKSGTLSDWFKDKLNLGGSDMSKPIQEWEASVGRMGESPAVKKAKKELEDLMKLLSGGAGAGSKKDPLEGIRKMRDELQKQIAIFGQGELAAKQWDIQHGEISKTSGKAATALKQETLALLGRLGALQQNKKLQEDKAAADEHMYRTLEKIKEAEIAETDAIRDMASAWEDAVDPVRVFERQLWVLDNVMLNGNLSIEAYSHQLNELSKTLNASLHPMAAVAKELEDAADPAQVFWEKMKQLDEMVLKYNLSAGAQAVYINRISKEYAEAMGQLGGSTETTLDRILNELEGWSKEFSAKLADTLTSGKASLGSFFGDILNMFSRILIREFIAQPIEDWIRTTVLPAVRSAVQAGMSGGGGGGFSFGSLFGGIGSSIGSAIGSLFSAPSIPSVSYTSLPFGTSFFASGGVIQEGFDGIVGDRGPERVTAGVATRVTPLSEEKVAVNFYISAVDGPSVQGMLYSQKEFIAGMIQQAFNKRGKSGIYD